MKKLLFVGLLTLCVAVVGVAWLSAAPTIGTTAANPAYVVINTPTPVVVTASIPDPSVVPTGVNLLRTDANGKTLATVGVMRDDGTQGDAVAGDKVFSLRTTVNEPTVGIKYFTVSAAFKGVLRRTVSSPIVVTVDPLVLPPDPGEPGQLTIEGIDVDHDGVRDDVQRYIGVSHYTRPQLLSPLAALARANQTFIVNHAADTPALLEIIRQRQKAQDCLVHLTGDYQSVLTMQQELRAITLNTKARFLAYGEADASLSGQFFPARNPAVSPDVCAF